MNPHFTSHNDETELPPIPRAGYARIDDVEMSRGGHYARVSFDMVDADWLDNCLAFDHKNIEENPLDFESMPLFHLEVVLKFSAHRRRSRLPLKLSRSYQTPQSRRVMAEGAQPDYGGDRYPYDWIKSAFDQSTWFFIDQTKKWKGHRADIYRNMSDDAKSINVDIQRFTSTKLDQIFTLPGTVVNTLGASVQALLNNVTCDRVIVFDVGQGNANGMVKDVSDAPELYFDVGAGVYRNQRTRPSIICLPAHNVKRV
ncbi:hypothetical protein G0D98_24305 [Pseudomonas savastanoi pv. phaseolicola]|uniref:hypothetical protein n=1 Tax=Pseudomonas savastanoi TaxID=29438 RepID=UPI000F4097CE|nr:hypothetical protein [Pseudomonas savastanoi]MBN3471518.1 hypothetical protein [Pseudomonas savastanoi pv. phaseolicola]MBN3478505.1 hypothetical protein [Pseudomonas savastanoi pv. phaseolicola]RMO24666.1 hypothetical protein ALQ46_00179 [Pseudomonas savastanoi pv. phaseolicola]